MELNLIEILKNAPVGTKLYCTLFGEVIFDGIKNVNNIVIHKDGDVPRYLDCDGKWFTIKDGECILFPSKDNRDWSTFKVDKKYKVGDYLLYKDTNKVYKISYEYTCEDDAYQMQIIVRNDFYPISVINIKENELDSNYELLEKFPLDSLKPFDRVIVKDDNKSNVWKCAFFSHLHGLQVYADSGLWDMCVPYNDDTKHLIGTTDEAPEFYKQ